MFARPPLLAKFSGKFLAQDFSEKLAGECLASLDRIEFGANKNSDDQLA